MFVDFSSNGPGGGGGEIPVCKGCKGLIGSSEPSHNLRFDSLDDREYDDLAGLYHSDCAKPYLSLLRAMEALRRFSF